MLRVDVKKPYQLVYSLCLHPYLGYLVEPHIIQLNPDGGFSLTHNRIFSHTAKDYLKNLDDIDHKLIKTLDEIEQTHLIKRYYKKPIRPATFFSDIFEDKLFETIRPKIEAKLMQVMPLLRDKPFFLMSKEGWPVERRLTIAEEPASILFHFRRTEEETRYFPTIKYKNLRIEFMFKDAQIVFNQPAWMMLEDTLYYFDQLVEGKKLLPFLHKRFISIGRSTEHKYYETFVRGLIEKHPVYAEGFEIQTHQHDATPVIKLIYGEKGSSEVQLHFRYGPYLFAAGAENKVTVRMQYLDEKDTYIFHRIKRSLQWEKNRFQELQDMGLEIPQDGQPIPSVIDWIQENYELLQSKGFEIEQDRHKPQFFFGKTTLSIEVTEDNDWFDVNAVAHFGSVRVPFIDLRNHILNNIHEFKLPTGEIAIIPEAWFAQFSNVFHFSPDKNAIRLLKHHIGLLNDIRESDYMQLSMDRKLQRLSEFTEMDDVAEPMHFNGSLRHYQKAGYNWFHFLKKYHFGGCLADDMGLGKTIQTLAMLQKVKEDLRDTGQAGTSLIIMPTSLIYNWQNEAARFAPELSILVHTGSIRAKSPEGFADYDLVVTTYGITRSDTELLKSFYFYYIILDESQSIKNPASKSFKAVRMLQGKNRLILSGTPVENSVADLWPQMSFVNPGLLGTHAYFQETFVNPIEKKKDEEQARRLQAMIKPFVLRRTKSQVATELPPKTEQLFFCKMEEDQEELYERTKSEYRNAIFDQINNEGVNKSQIQMLQGLTKLRQLANHPRMLDRHYKGASGKFENVVHTLENVLERGHKVLIFSQFVKQLDIYRDYFDKHHISYAYLDGATKNRESVVEEFRQNDTVKLFLISIKAGGVGLNLVEADYVFILDPWWNPAVEQQAIDRTHRIGQTRNVFIYKFITKDSVEEKILALQNRKKVIAESLITTEESFVKSLSADDIRDLLS
ncbi:Helicase conserved C-terminal domain-containing protein [bacterium A37T11]|nr:Helicase conserved C-terminal domain-containing protein [bacterium A37T11]